MLVNFKVYKLDLEMAEEPEIKLPTSAGSLKKQESSRKASISALFTMPKPLTLLKERKMFCRGRCIYLLSYMLVFFFLLLVMRTLRFILFSSVQSLSHV